MSASKAEIAAYIKNAVTHFSNEMASWSKEQLEKLISSQSLGGLTDLKAKEVVEALDELERQKIVKFIGSNEHYIVLHPEYVELNLSDYVRDATLKKVKSLIGNK